MKTENKHIDEIIKEALEHLEAAPNEGHWELMEERLDAEIGSAENTVSPAQDFDKLMMTSLGNLEADYDPNSWDLMEEKLVAEETAIDDIAYNKLNNFEAPFKGSHWQLMAQRLEEEFSLRRKLYKYKVAELALMLLLLITLINYLPFGGNKLQELKEWHKQHIAKKQGLIADNATILLDKADSKADNEGSNESTKQTSEDSELQSLPNEIPPLVKTNTPQYFQKPLVRIPNRISTPNNLIQSSSKEYINHLKFAGFSQAGLDLALDKTLNKSSILAALAIPKPDVLNYDANLPPMILEPNPQNGEWRFSLFGNYDLTYVLSGRNNELGTKPDTTLGSGYGGGLMVAYKRGRWGVEFGGQYSHKKYNSPLDKSISNVPGNKNTLLIENLENIQLDILQIPVNIQYFAVDKSKWRLYASAGASLHLISLPVYEIESNYAFLNSSAPPGGTGTGGGSPLKNSSDFPEGIFSGGSFKDNSFFTANLGFGLERSLGQRWNIYAQPSYQHYFSKNGIKPFKDRFYNLSMSIGARVSLK